MAAATPSSEERSFQHHRHHHKHHHGEARRRVHQHGGEASHHSHNEYDGDDHNDHHYNNKDGNGDSSHGYESDDDDFDDDNDGSISPRYLFSEERELSPGAESARSEWTLQTFADHHQRQQQRQHEQASHLDGGRRSGGVKRSLSLTSAHSNNVRHHDKKSSGKNFGKSHSVAPLDRIASSSLSTTVRDHSGHYNRRTLLPKLLLVCTALCVLSGPFLLSTTKIMTSFTNLYMGVVNISTKIYHASGADDNDNEEDWHPMFQHSKRTADVEVGVPTTTKPHNIPANEKKDATVGTEGSSSSATRQDESQRRAADDTTNNGGRSGLESFSVQQQHRRRAKKENLPRFRPDGYTRQTSNANGEGGGEEEESSNGGVPNFVQGEVVQNLCPATHTLLSQSLILCSSYGNIFSITTPDSPASKRKRSDDRKGKGGSTNAGGAGSGSDPQRRTQFRQKRQQQQQLSDAPTGRPTTAAAFWASAPINTATSTDSTTRDTTTAPTPSPIAGDPTVGPTSAAPNPTGDNANNQFEGDYNDIDTATDSTYTGSGVETITVQTLSLRMADFKPEQNAHFEVWLYTGSGDDIVLNRNDLDDDPSNDNSGLGVPSKGEYQSSRAKFTNWVLVSEGLESELIPDTDFFDNNGHVPNIGAGNTIGPLGRLDEFENMEDVTLQARVWNEGAMRTDGGMDAVTAEGGVTTTYYYKIPEEKFMPLKLPKYDGKLTLFVTLDRVGLQYGYAAKQEFDQVDVTKHDYIDQTPSLDVLNGNVNLKMSVGEGVILYPWIEEEFFYQARRFLGKIWYEARIPCEYAPIAEVLDVPDVESAAPSNSPEEMPSLAPSGAPSLAPSMNGTNVTTELLISVLIKNGELSPMPFDVQEVFEDKLFEFLKDGFGEFCPITWNEGANVVDQDLTPVGGPSSSGSTLEGRRRRYIDGGEDPQHVSKRKKTTNGGGRYLRRLLEPIFYPSNKARSRLLNTITLLDISTVVDAVYSSNTCPGKTPEELAALLETYVNDNDGDFLDLLKAAHDYFKDAFGVSADVVGGPIVGVKAMAVEEEEDGETPVGTILGGLLGALLLCCFCCCLPLLVIRRRKQKKSRENDIIREDIQWAHPVEEDHFPPLGGYRDDTIAVGGDGEGSYEENSKRRKRPEGELLMENETPPDVGVVPIPPGIRPTPDDTQMLHDHRYLDREDPDKPTKQRPFELPGRTPGDEDNPVPNNINIYPGGDYQDDEDDPDGFRLRPIEKKNIEKGDSEWTPDNYEPDGGVHGYDRPQKPSPDIDPNCNRLPQKEEPPAPPKKKLSIRQLVLQRRRDLEAKEAAMRHVERVETGMSDEEEDQMFPKAEPDSRIEDLMGRIKELEVDRKTKYQRPQRFEEESDYERWKRLNVQESELSSSGESSDEEFVLPAVERKKKKKKEGNDYMLHFDDLDAYNGGLAVHQDAYIHKWVKVKVEKGKEGEEEDGANLDDLEMENVPNRGAGDGAEEGEELGEYLGEKGTLEGGEEDHYPAEGVEADADDGNVNTFDAPHTMDDPGDYDSAEDDDQLAKMDEELARMDEELARMDQKIAQMDDDDA